MVYYEDADVCGPDHLLGRRRNVTVTSLRDIMNFEISRDSLDPDGATRLKL